MSFIFTSCSLVSDPESKTVTIKLKTDTYISKKSDSNHSESKSLLVSKSDNNEERILLRLPTNDDGDNFFEDCFSSSSLCSIFFMPVSIVIQILTDDCEELSADNLTSAILILNTEDGSSIAAGDLKINLLKKPWWHTVSWNFAHPFSEDGKWKKSGGDIDNSVDFEDSCTSLSEGTCAADEIKFEMTEYFRDLLNKENNKHYGLIISPTTDLERSSIYAVQAKSDKSPRVDATYTCDSDKGSLKRKTFYLGSEIK